MKAVKTQDLIPNNLYFDTNTEDRIELRFIKCEDKTYWFEDVGGNEIYIPTKEQAGLIGLKGNTYWYVE